ncbi:YjbH domain-containing protein [Fontimonas sp. SYSU GA230001]|uniref:YjbH domain-containing protein n=1 Tax=Fontimonas sp. SYSU GA230001 TaxID=3142450 RepID=UPI0032B3A1CE
MRAAWRWLLGAAGLVCVGMVRAEPDWVSQIGYPGALQTPSAFAEPEGTFAFGISSALPYNTLYVSLQPFSWLNFGARYTDITDRRYASSTTGQSYKDKAFDLSLRLVEGGGAFPAVAAGIIDIGGTGLFASEYLVASQRIFDVYATLGLGWGRLGSAGDFRNPLIGVSDSFRTRRRIASGLENTGRLAYKAWFRGEDTALFGSLVWNPGFLSDWSFIVEVEGNDYSHEPAKRPVSAPSRVNYGVAYVFGPDAKVGLSYLRGDTIAFSLGISPTAGTNQIDAAARAPLPELASLRHPAYRPVLSDELARNLEQIYRSLQYRGFAVHAIDWDEASRTVTVWQTSFTSKDPLYIQQFVSRIVAGNMGVDVRSVKVATVAAGVEAVRVETPYPLVEADARGEVGEDEYAYLAIAEPGQGWAMDRASFPDLLDYPTWTAGINPAYRANIGGPQGFILGQVLLRPYFSLQLVRSLSFTTSIAVNVYSELDQVSPVRSGSLPPVRSDLELYQSQSGDVYLEQMSADFIFPIAQEWYGRLSAGIFEEMYGGVAGEILYRPFSSRFAVSLNGNYVKKRAYDQRFDFLDYEVATGFLTFYYATPWQGVTVNLSAGRYLAKDLGGTLEVAREFRNGARFGVFATKTNVSAKEFGEGSFDKGFFFSIPLEVGPRKLNNNSFSTTYRFLSRDGGARASDGRSLYPIFGSYSASAIDNAR